VQARWRRQERDGTRRDEYFPNEFLLTVQVKGLSPAQQLRLFDAIVKSYQERVKFEQHAATSFVAGVTAAAYRDLAANYDFWDIPALFAQTYRPLDRELRAVIAEASQYSDAKYHLGFRRIALELTSWQAIRLGALEALTYQGGLVKDKALTMQRVQHQIEDLDIQIRQKSREADEGIRLLGLIDRSKAVVAGALPADKSLPVVDAGAIDRLLKNDYVGPVVVKVSKLQTDIQELEVERGRLQKQLTHLPKASNVELARLPPRHAEVIRALSADLERITQSYDALLDEYLTATIIGLVAVRQSPIVVRDSAVARQPLLILAGIVVSSAVLAVVLIAVEQLFQRVTARPLQETL
jgi:hypothetical protein